MHKLISELISNHDLWLETRTIERNDFVSQPGEVERYFYYVEEGALRVFFLTELEEITIRFGYKGSIMTSLPSFFTEQPTIFYIQAIRKCKIRVMEKKRFFEFVRQEPFRMQQYELFLQSLVTQQIEREIDILTYSPIERLRRVQERSPHLFQEIPSKYIASYLRMTPETLSRIRKS